jgi:GntR family transcriptional regulator
MAGPMYRKIADDLRAQIESGELPPGSRLPTEIELMELHQASRNTVRDAIKLLASRGLVEPRPGQGTFVFEKINPFITTLTGKPEISLGGGETNVYVAEVEASGRKPANSRPRVEIQQAEPGVAESLRIEAGSPVVSRHQQRTIDGIPWSLQTSFYPMTLVEHGATKLLVAEDLAEGTIAYLARECGIKQAGYRDSIAVRPPDENEASFFKIPLDGRVPVFVIFRTGFDEEGQRFRLTITVYPADRNRFVVNVGDVPASGSAG